MSVTIDGNTGVSLVQDDTITDVKLALDANASEIKDALNATGSAPIYACRAWVNFNGTGTVAINGDGNVSSISDNGTGTYVINFTTAMPDSTYSTTCGFGRAGTNDFIHLAVTNTTSQGIEFYSGGSKTDGSNLRIAIFR